MKRIGIIRTVSTLITIVMLIGIVMPMMNLYVNATETEGKSTVSVPGDVNSDGVVDGRDSTRLLQYLAEWDVTIDYAAADCNGDGTVDGRDSTRLLQYLAEWDVTLESSAGRIYSRDFTLDDVVTEEDGVMQYVRNEILVVANESASFSDIDTVAKSVGGEIVGCIEITGDYQISFNNKTETELKALIDSLKENPLIDDAVLNYVTEFTSDSVEVNDPWFRTDSEDWYTNLQDWDESKPAGRNWGLEAIKAPSAWDYADQMSNIKIGILDNGFNVDHPDLTNVVNKSFLNTVGRNIIDINGKAPGHGSHTLGTFAAQANNRTGITGVFPNMINGTTPKAEAYCIDNITTGSTLLNNKQSLLQTKESFVELICRNIKVINISEADVDDEQGWAATFGNESAQEDIQSIADPLGDLLHRLIEKGYEFVIVNSAGNSSQNPMNDELNNDPLFYEDENAKYGWRKDTIDESGNLLHKNDDYYGKIAAKWNSSICAIDNHQDVVDRIIVVGAVYNKGNGLMRHKGYGVCAYSNWGERVDVLAPGGRVIRDANGQIIDEANSRIYSSSIDTANNYEYMQGTSMAAPHVSGVAAMVWAVNNDLTGAEVKQIISSTTSVNITDKLNTFTGIKRKIADTDKYITGLLDAKSAVEEAFNRRGEDYVPDFEEKTEGAIVTKVVDVSTNNPPRDAETDTQLTDITVNAYKITDGVTATSSSASAPMDADGEVYLVAEPGTYELIVEHEGFISGHVKAEIYPGNQVTYAEWIKLIREGRETESEVSGRILNALNVAPIKSASVIFENADTKEKTSPVYTDENGFYSATLPVGIYMMYVSADGFSSTEVSAYSLSQPRTSLADITLNPLLPDGEYRIVLHWGEYPRDLDSHVIGTLSNGSSFHTYFSNMSSYDNGALICNLDVDDTSSYGPETITLHPNTSNKYTYYIYNYSGNGAGTLANSQCWIQLFAGDQEYRYYVPTDQGDGRYWTVFSITNGAITTINTVGNNVS